jgi:hypothetical protein
MNEAGVTLAVGATSTHRRTRAPSLGRVATLDFFRGVGLWTIYIDHIDPNVWSYLTLGRFGFSDFAEVFVFISGYVNAAMYSRLIEIGGFPAALQKLLSRMARLYIAHIATMVLSLALLAAGLGIGLKLSDPGLYVWSENVGHYITRILLLQYAPGLNFLLPLYIIGSPVLVLAVIGLRKVPWITLAASLALWAADQMHVFDPLLRNLEGWTFHPLAWQLLFVIGAAVQMYRERLERVAESGAVRRVAVAVLFSSLALRALPLFEAGRNVLLHLDLLARLLIHDAGKARLAPSRLVHFLSLLVLVAVLLPRGRRWRDSAVAKLAIACGRDSVFVFSMGLVMSYAADLLILRFNGGPALQFVCSSFGVVAMCTVAWFHKQLPEWKEL